MRNRLLFGQCWLSFQLAAAFASAVLFGCGSESPKSIANSCSNTGAGDHDASADTGGSASMPGTGGASIDDSSCAGGSVGDSGGDGGDGGDGAYDWSDGLGSGVQWGLAADYVGDVGIVSSPYVIAAEDFETGVVTIPTEYDRFRNSIEVTRDEAYTGVYSGKYSWPQGHEGPTTRYILGELAHQGDKPAYFIRMCFMFDHSFHPVDLERAVNVKGFGIYFENGSGNAQTCDGMNWYNVSCQFTGWGPSTKPQANDGFLWVGLMYSYNRYPSEAQSALGRIEVSPPPDGTQSCRFSSYAETYDFIQFDKWRCYEVGLYLNTPGQYDGEARFWIDGVLQSRAIHMRFRDVEDNKPNNMQLNLYRGITSFPHTMVRYVDNIVLARRYIGPVKKSE